MNFLLSPLLIVYTCLILLCSFQNWLFAENGQSLKGTYRAISLRALQRQLRSLEKNKTIPPQDIIHLAGITKMVGYVKGKGDVVLFGRTDENLPVLYLDDMVIALRNAFNKYTHLRGNTRFYSYPGCSIDPDTQSLSRLLSIGEKFDKAKNIKEQKTFEKLWYNECETPQRVRIFGCPFNTRFAQVMVQADYDMKNIINGKDDLAIPSFQNLTLLTMQKGKKAFRKTGKVPDFGFNYNRYWFHPKDITYYCEKGMVSLKNCTVQLLTERQQVSKTGNLLGMGDSDSLAQLFIDQFNNHFSKISRIRSIFQELENLYRFSALAQALKHKPGFAPTFLGYLLNDYTIHNVDVAKNLPGRSRLTYQKLATATHWIRVSYPSCGGVSMEMKIKDQTLQKVKEKRMNRVKTIIFKAKSRAKALFWDFKL